LPVEAQIAPEELEKLRQKWLQEQKQQQAAPSPQKEGGADKPKPQSQKPQAAPQQQGPPAPGGMNPVQKWTEENIAIPVTDFIDNTFKGDQQSPEEIAKMRAAQRAQYQSDQVNLQNKIDTAPGGMFTGELVRGLAGGVEDFAEGAVNLPGQAANFVFGSTFKPVNFGLVRENSTSAGKGLRTLTRYVTSSRQFSRLGFGNAASGAMGFATRAGQGFIEDFVGADGTAEDGTLIGSTPFTQMLQTNDSNDPIVNRALVGLEGALFESVGAPAVEALWKVVGGSKAITKLDEVARAWSKGAKKRQLDQMILNVERNLGIKMDQVAKSGDPIQDLLAETRRMLTDPQVLRDQRKAAAVAEYHRAAREIAAPKLAKQAQARLKKLLADTFAQDNYGSTLDYTKATERDLALRLIQEDPSRMKLNQLIAEAAETVDETDPVLQYLRARADAYEASKMLDDVANTVKYGGDPDERVFDVTRLPDIQDEIGRIDAEKADFSANLAKADEGLAKANELIESEAALGGQLNLQIADLTSKLDSFPTAEEIAKQSSIKLSLSKAQVDRINSLTLPEGVTITPGRRVQGLTADNIDDFRAAVAELGASGDKVASNLSARLDNLEVPPKSNFQSREAIQAQLDDLVARRNDIFGKQVESRQQAMVAKAEADKLRANVEQLTVQKEAITSRMSGKEADFQANYVPVKLDRSNVTSIVKEGGGGQPGFDLYFEDKRFPALLDGRVKEIGRQGNQSAGYGNYIVVESIDPKTGQTVDVLYAHLADGSIKVKEGDMVGVGQQIGTQGGTGSVRSVDGTIASVDFLAPAPKGSKSMTPYGRWSQLVDELSLAIHKGELQPSQVGRKAPSVMPEVVEQAARQADELVPTMTRAQAVTEAGYNVDQVAPVAARTDIVEDLFDDTPVNEVVTGGAKPGKASLTDMDVQTMAVGEEGLLLLQRLTDTISTHPTYTLASTQGKIPEALELAREFLTAGDDAFARLLDDPRFVAFVDGNPLLTTEGNLATIAVVKELQRQTQELSESVLRNSIDGSPQAGQDAARLLDRLTAMLKIRTDIKKTAGGKVAEFDFAGRLSPSMDGGAPQLPSGYLKKMQEDLANQVAKEENLYQQFAQLRTRLVNGDKDAFRELERAAKVMRIMHPTQKNFNDLGVALAGVGKGLDALYVNALLSGPITTARNFWGNFYQTIGHPMQALLGASLPGKQNALVRKQAMAAIGATWETRQEALSLFSRMYKKQWDSMGPDAKEYVIWDEKLATNMAQLQQKIENGEVGWFASMNYGLAITLRKIVDSPIMRPMMAAMGATDNYFKVLAGRQVAAKRAVEYAMDALGDAPMTAKRTEKFGKLVAEFKEKELRKIFSEDGLEVLDDEAIKLGQTFTFQTPIDESDWVTRKLNEISMKPGMKLLGLTFVKTPSNILKSSANLTPVLSTILKNRDLAYKNGDAYYRAMRDGAEAMSWLVGIGGLTGGASGMITGAGPLRGDDRDLWLTNHKPFTITVGKFEFNYQALEPAATILGMFADMGALMVDDSKEHDFLPSVMAIVTSNVINKTYLTQISTVASLVTAQDPREITKVLENMANIVPYSSARRQWGQIIDPAQREVRSRLEEFWPWMLKKQGGLGASKLSPQRVDPVTGEELTKDGVDGPIGSLVGVAQMFAGGLRLSRNRFKPVHRAMDAEGYDMTNKTKELAGELLGNEQMVEYNKLRAGNGALEKELLDYFKSEQYLKIDKPNSEYQRQNGFEASQTDAYGVIDQIVQRHHNRAVATMEAGLNAPTLEWADRVGQMKNIRKQVGDRAGQVRRDVMYGTKDPNQIIQQFQY
jgi:murein DD-endopeptidase MepM/ murein hydrolase activator NlpD